ncbi:proteoglycan 4-like [Aphis craccivora]|uniref:Proteoglycan 4-like n=1 Tax=Aphis craccivora TaxID=307492 RepID=A0A6G0ZLI0_APHCR|nr:proteoglycan 4-like [Aphis craccivora]
MDSAGSARHLLVVATVIAAIALCRAAAVGGGTGPIPGNTAASAPSSILTKLPQSPLPKFPVIYTYGKPRSPRPPTTNHPTLLSGKQPQRPAPQPQRPSQQQQQPPQQPQKRPPPKPTTDERPDGRVPPYQSSPATNASVTTSPRPKLETTTQDRSIITAPLKSCPEGMRMSPDRTCRPAFTDPEGDQTA